MLPLLSILESIVKGLMTSMLQFPLSSLVVPLAMEIQGMEVYEEGFKINPKKVRGGAEAESSHIDFEDLPFRLG